MKKLYYKIAGMEQEKFNTTMNFIVAVVLVIGLIYAFNRGLNIYNAR